jgi:tetratricopeptide (TPR) repeat protein
MGLVYLAEDQRQRRPVVLKFLREDLLEHPRLAERFRREAAAAIQLKHPNIVAAYALEQLGRAPALVMEYIDGTDLDRFVRQTGPLPVAVACELIRQAALGLQFSFEQGMVHRDVKPSNLMVTRDGTVKVLDFGLAKMQSELAADPGLTSTGAFLGSVDYMAPEQADDPRRADIRADIYSLGCTLYFLLSGAPPFRGATFDVLEAHHSNEPPHLNECRPDVSAELALLVAKLMAKNPSRRFQTPGKVARALVPFVKVTGTPPKSPGPFCRREDRSVSPTTTADLTEDDLSGVSIAVEPRRKPWYPFRRGLAAAASVVLCVTAGWIVYRIFTTELVFEAEVPDIAVRVTQGDRLVALVLPTNRYRLPLDPGEYALGLTPPDSKLRITREKVTLRRGDKLAVAVKRVQPDPLLADYLDLMQRLDAPAHAIYDRGSGGLWNFNPSLLARVPADARFNLGLALARHGWQEAAIRAFASVLEAQPQDADAIYNVGTLLMTQGKERLDEAISYFREALRLEPDAADVHFALGLTLVERGDTNQGLSELRAAVAIRPDNLDGWRDLGLLLKRRYEFAAAIVAFRNIIRQEPEMASAYDSLADLLEMRGRVAEATDIRMQTGSVRGVAVAQNERGIALAKADKLADAVVAFRRAIRVEPALAEAHSNLGAALLDQEEFAAADAALCEALRLGPGIAEAHVNFAIGLKRQGAFAAAETACREAVRLLPGIDLSRPCCVGASVPTGKTAPLRAPPLRRPRQRRQKAAK